MKKRITYFILCITLYSCEKIIEKPRTTERSRQKIFDEMWQVIDEKYSYLTVKNIDWSVVKAKYRPTDESISEDSLFNLMSAALYELKDGHVNIFSPFNIGRNWEWYLGYPQNYDQALLDRYYLKDAKYAGAFTYKVFTNTFGKKIGYIKYGSFSYGIDNTSLNYILSEFKTEKISAVIIDVRDNGGGSTANVFALCGRFVKEKTLVGYDYEKVGKGHNDFSAAKALYVEPTSSLRITNLPIYILTNRSCYSATTLFVGYMKALPYVTTIGDDTGGGGGLPIGYQLSNGWYFRYSATKTLMVDNSTETELGIPVDVKVDMSSTSRDAGIDDIIEKAFSMVQ